MRLLTPRRVAVTALCAALTLGTAGPALAAHSALLAPAQRAGAPEDISDILGSIGGVVDSVLATASGTSSTQTIPSAGTNQEMKELTAAIEALRKAMAEANTRTNTGTAATTVPTTGTSGTTGGTDSWAATDEAPLEPAGGTDAPDVTDPAAEPAADTTDTDVDKALAAMDKAIDELVAAAAKGQATTSASQVQAATQTLMDAIMKDVTKMTDTPATGVSTLPATTLPATSTPQMPVAAR
ncbi:hypothetical protein ABZ508_00200 [Streptomyces lavendulocolor]|uniref:Secreted protein n=1 Tax=Streptomyces lavendulocolor TaxID=67316 RepID=A0ABV2W0H5_9ACTN